VAHKARGLGLALIASDPVVTPGEAAALDVQLVELDELLDRSDYVTLHCPLVPATRGLIGAPQLARMKSSAYLLNLSRGPVVQQSALVDALSAGIIAGAALDVYETEPLPPDDPLLGLPNVILTPHSSSWSLESVAQLRRDTAQHAIDALRGELPRTTVNRAALGR
jgi:D-3-phosphoglycerate dehydrogenase